MTERELPQVSEDGIFPSSFPAFKVGQFAPFLIVFFSGANLILVQWVMTREMTTVLLGTEIVILLTSVSYFVGLSIGYMFSGRIRRRWLPIMGILTLGLHLTLPVTFRLVVAWLGMNDAYWVAFLVLPLITPFVVSMFYSVFLPHFVDGDRIELGSLYVVELLGSIAGVITLVFLAERGLQTIYTIYAIGLIIVLLALGIQRWLAAILSIFSLFWILALPTLNIWSNEFWYRTLLGFPEGTTILFSGYSPYQKVDVLEMPDGERALYLDGLSHFNGSYGIRLNTIVGDVPATLVNPQNSLVIGAGVMQTEQLLAIRGGHVTTVELGPMVADVGQHLFYNYNQMDTLMNRTVVVDDAKHFLANTDVEYDLIVGDTPAAISIQPATLYSMPFYQSIDDHLSSRGVFVGNMTSRFVPGDMISSRVASSLLEVFDEVIVVTPASVGWSFAFAADKLPFTRTELETVLRQYGEVQFSVFETAAVRAIVGDTPPITLDSMDFVLQTSAEWIAERLAWNRGS
jgi:predicted membrane-bound spermidine synthase